MYFGHLCQESSEAEEEEEEEKATAAAEQMVCPELEQFQVLVILTTTRRSKQGKVAPFHPSLYIDAVQDK